MASTSTSRRALLVCDVQLGILPIALGTDEEATTAYVGRCNTAIAHARSKGDKVIFIRVGFEPGHPEVGPKNKAFSQIKANNGMVVGTDATKLHPALDVQTHDPVLTKTRFGMFSNTSLRSILTSHDIDTIILAGVATGGVILTTVCEGFDFDYRVIVLSDACQDRSQTVHDTLINEVFPRRGDVMTVQAFTELTN